jgi:hypothetical protein
MKSPHARILTEQLRPLTPLDADTLARVAGGESASTSASGTPAAGDDTIGDRGLLPDVYITSYSISGSSGAGLP